ncbi:MAG: DinB family protein [Salinivirgaceae bacterium]
MDFSSITNAILRAVETWEPELNQLPRELITGRRNRQNRSIKQILGHLIDSAANNHQRMARLQYNKVLVFPDYQQDNDLWIALQNYQNADWQTIIQLWKMYNLHIIQVIQSVDITALDNCWHNFEGTAVSLRQMIEGYPEHLTLHMNEIRELINAKS